jgi:hypothetical protein
MGATRIFFRRRETYISNVLDFSEYLKLRNKLNNSPFFNVKHLHAGASKRFFFQEWRTTLYVGFEVLMAMTACGLLSDTLPHSHYFF